MAVCKQACYKTQLRQLILIFGLFSFDELTLQETKMKQKNLPARDAFQKILTKMESEIWGGGGGALWSALNKIA